MPDNVNYKFLITAILKKCEHEEIVLTQEEISEAPEQFMVGKVEGKEAIRLSIPDQEDIEELKSEQSEEGS